MVFCCRLAEECRELEYVSLHCTADMGQAVVTALNTADLGWDDDAHRLRTIRLYVPRVWQICTIRLFVPRVWQICTIRLYAPRVWQICTIRLYAPRVWQICTIRLYAPRVWQIWGSVYIVIWSAVSRYQAAYSNIVLCTYIILELCSGT